MQEHSRDKILPSRFTIDEADLFGMVITEWLKENRKASISQAIWLMSQPLLDLAKTEGLEAAANHLQELSITLGR